jgi:hypothetical protein
MEVRHCRLLAVGSCAAWVASGAIWLQRRPNLKPDLLPLAACQWGTPRLRVTGPGHWQLARPAKTPTPPGCAR